ncbi:hypothetical protein HYPSUDRAFT_60346, partial [Hypholoma sublateritium FD-334 SS-4]
MSHTCQVYVKAHWVSITEIWNRLPLDGGRIDAVSASSLLRMGAIRASGGGGASSRSPTAARLSGATKKMIASDPALEEDVFAVTELLRLHFAEHAEQDDVPTMTRQAVEQSLEVMTAFDEGGDIGVGPFYAKTDDELCRLLDFPNCRPVLWNQYRALDSAVTPWDTGETEKSRLEFQTGGGRMNPRPITLFTHQLQAVASVVQMMFSPDRVRDKGAFLVQVFEYQRGLQDGSNNSAAVPRGEPKAKIFSSDEEILQFMGGGPVPNLPSLLLLPNSLVDQTIREFKAFQQFHSVDIQRIPGQVEKA